MQGARRADPTDRRVKTGPCKENIMRGKDVNLLKFPIPTWTPGSTPAPYLSAGAVIQKDPETGIQNAGVYRGMIKGPNRIGILGATGQTFRRHHAEIRGSEQADADCDRHRFSALSRHDVGGARAVRRRRDGRRRRASAASHGGREMRDRRPDGPGACRNDHRGDRPARHVREQEGPFGEFYGHMGPVANRRSSR